MAELAVNKKKPPDPSTRVELDSHADTCAFGSNCLVVQDSGDSVRVQGYAGTAGKSHRAKIVTAAVAYECPTTFNTYILFFPQSLYIPTLETHLVCPYQMRQQGIQVNEVPLLHTKTSDRSPTTHSISTEDLQLHIPLELKGVMSGFETRKPTWKEVRDSQDNETIHVHMTNEAEWKPHSKTPAEEEAGLRAHLTNEYDIRIYESRQLSHLHLRGQDSGDSMIVETVEPEDDLSLALSLTEDDKELWLEEPKTVSALRNSKPTVSFADSAPEIKMFFPELPAASELMDYRKISLVGTEELKKAHGVASANDVDSLADSWLIKDDPHFRSLSAKHSNRKRKGFVSPEELAANWKIGLEAAKRTIDNTTQMAVRDFKHTSGGRRLKPYHWVVNQPRLDVDVFTDTLIAKCKSLRGNKYAQVFATAFHFSRVIPLKSKGDAHQALDEFFTQVGIPAAIIPDNAKELTQGEFKKKANKAQCPIKPIEAYTPNANVAEHVIRELKRSYRRIMIEKTVPEVLWDYCLEWVSHVRTHTSLFTKGLDGKTPATMMTGDTCDISFLCEFGFYDWVWYISPQGSEGQEDMQRKRLGRYLGPSTNVGDAMCGTVLTEKGSRLDRTSIIPLSIEDRNNEEVTKRKQVFERILESKLGERVKALKDGKPAAAIDEEFEHFTSPLEDKTPDRVEYIPWSLEELGYKEFMDTEDKPAPVPELKEADDIDWNKYVSAKVSIPKDGHTFANGKVVRRARDECGDLVGTTHSNPLLDTSEYEVQFEDGAVERYTANIIAEHLYSRTDTDGTTVDYVEGIINHKSDSTAMKEGEGSGLSTTKGWKLLCQLKHGPTEWIKLKDLKESHPVEVAEYAELKGLLKEPAFAWWCPHVLRKRNRILKAMKTRYHRTEQKFGIEIPKTVKRALEIDAENGNTFWRDAIAKEMATVKVAFDIQPEGSGVPVGKKFLKCHLIFDVKAGSLIRKARFVADGSRTQKPDCNTYASVVSRESVRIAFMLAALNDLEVFVADCEGAYLNAKSLENLYTKLGPEFGEYEGRCAVIVRALYGTKSAAASWRATISGVIKKLGFEMCRADNDVWMRPAVKANGEKVWEYLLVYSDDILAVGINPKRTLMMIDQHYKLKPDSLEIPTKYLGADIGKYQLPDGTWAWYMGSESYVKAAVDNVELWLKGRNEHLKTKASCVFPSGWKPELDTTDLLKDEDASYYQQQIGVLRWMCELGRIDILTEVSMLAAYSAAPRQGHLLGVLHLYTYLKKHKRSKMVFDPIILKLIMTHIPPMIGQISTARSRSSSLQMLLKPEASLCRQPVTQTQTMLEMKSAGDPGLASSSSATGPQSFSFPRSRPPS